MSSDKGANQAPASAEQVMRTYEGLARRSRRLVDSARARDWDALIEEQSGYLLDVEWLSRSEARVSLDERLSARKAALLETILAGEKVVRECLLARREELDRYIGLSRRRRDLKRSYGPQEAAVVDGRAHFERARFEKGRP